MVVVSIALDLYFKLHMISLLVSISLSTCNYSTEKDPRHLEHILCSQVADLNTGINSNLG